MEITTKTNLSPATICNLFVGAFEGGSNYWLQRADLKLGGARKKKGLVWWGAEAIFAGPYSFEVRYDDPNDADGEGKGRKLLTQDDVAKGLTLMAEKSPEHFADIVSENDDNTTHDVFMQYVVLGEIVYG